MAEQSVYKDIPGGPALLDWFGVVPSFHDAYLLELGFRKWGTGTMRIHTWQLTNEIDTQGHFVTDRHVVVILNLNDAESVTCTNFDVGPAIIFGLDIERLGEAYRIAWTSSYGAEGTIVCRHLHILLEPGDPRVLA